MTLGKRQGTPWTTIARLVGSIDSCLWPKCTLYRLTVFFSNQQFSFFFFSLDLLWPSSSLLSCCSSSYLPFKVSCILGYAFLLNMPVKNDWVTIARTSQAIFWTSLASIRCFCPQNCCFWLFCVCCTILCKLQCSVWGDVRRFYKKCSSQPIRNYQLCHGQRSNG